MDHALSNGVSAYRDVKPQNCCASPGIVVVVVFSQFGPGAWGKRPSLRSSAHVDILRFDPEGRF